MVQIALLRHGHTDWNRSGRIQGRTDIPLDNEARAELGRMRLPERWQGAALYSSPLQRAAETARLVACEPRTVPELTEMNWGDWEGAHGKKLADDPSSGFRHIEDWGWAYRPPNGETPQEVWNRIEPWLTGLDHESVLVCHIGIMRVLLAKAFNWPFQGEAPFRVKRNRLFVLSLENGLLRPAEPLIERLEHKDT